MEDNKNLRVGIDKNENQFKVNGKRIWFNGVNTPWHRWNDFGGAYDDKWWDEHFAMLHDAGINSVRVWINCNNGQGAVLIDDNGMISGVSDKHWSDLDLFFKTAERNKLYIMATLISFDHFKDDGKRPEAKKWRAMLLNDDASASFAGNYTVPFLKRYGENPWLWCIDICNEPEWAHETPEGGRLPLERISYFMAVNAAAIHENSKTLVTVGVSFPKYNADGGNCEGNKYSDEYLQKLYPNPNAHLDFWAQHYYDWVGPIFGVPYYIKPYGARPDGYQLDPSKPALITECPAKGSSGKTPGTENNTIITDYENAFLNGWQGVMPWTSNHVDGNGGFDFLSPATIYMRDKYRELVFPWE